MIEGGDADSEIRNSNTLRNRELTRHARTYFGHNPFCNRGARFTDAILSAATTSIYNTKTNVNPTVAFSRPY